MTAWLSIKLFTREPFEFSLERMCFGAKDRVVKKEEYWGIPDVSFNVTVGIDLCVIGESLPEKFFSHCQWLARMHWIIAEDVNRTRVGFHHLCRVVIIASWCVINWLNTLSTHLWLTDQKNTSFSFFPQCRWYFQYIRVFLFFWGAEVKHSVTRHSDPNCIKIIIIIKILKRNKLKDT